MSHNLDFNTADNLGYYRVAACSPEVALANPKKNAAIIIEQINDNPDCDLYLFPELSITGYTCADLFNQSLLLDAADAAIKSICDATADNNALIIVGAPRRVDCKLYNCAVVLHRGCVIASVIKRHLPNYNEFYEKRWFSAASHNEPYTIISHKGVNVGIELCEDLWVPEPPSGKLCKHGAEIIANLSATNEMLGKHRYLKELICQQSARCRTGYVYASAGCGESSTDLVFAGNAIVAEDGCILGESKRFADSNVCVICDIDVEKLRNDRRKYNSFSDSETQPDYKVVRINAVQNTVVAGASDSSDARVNRQWIREVDPYPFVPSSVTHLDENCSEIVEMQCAGLKQRLKAIGCRKLVVGISGGLDSTLALLVACRTFDILNTDRRNIIGITMPGPATTSRTRNNATDLMAELGVTQLKIPIGKAVAQHFEDIGQNPECHDAAYENSQARERTQILMDYANKVGAIVLGTGDLSELALGWATYNGDHMSMYGVNASIPKTLVRHLVNWFAIRTDDEAMATTLRSIIDTPISPELVPARNEDEIAQKTEDLVGPYELHDFFIYHMLRNGFAPSKIYKLALKAFEEKYDRQTVMHWLQTFYRRFFSQQFKRSCMPDGPKVGSVCLSPRGDWRMPSDATAALWQADLESLIKSPIS